MLVPRSATRAGSTVSPVPPRTIAHWRSKLGDPDALTAARVEPWVRETLLSYRRPAPLDYRVNRILKTLPQRLADAEAVSLPALATSVGLSPSRLMHLFTASVGVPLRPYILWLRLQYAAGELARAGPSPLPVTRRGSLTRRISPARFAGCWALPRDRCSVAGWLRVISISEPKPWTTSDEATAQTATGLGRTALNNPRSSTRWSRLRLVVPELADD